MATRATVEIAVAVLVHVPGAATPDYRDFTVMMADDDEQIGQDFMPYPTSANVGRSLINYQAAPAGDGPTAFRDPGNVPWLTAYAGDPMTVHVLMALLSTKSNAVTPATAPGRPVIRFASSGVAGGSVNAVARWTPPALNGGSAVTGYVVTAIRLNANGTVASMTRSAVRPSSLRSLTMTLRSGRYRFVVQARHRVGLSVYSTRSNVVRAR